MFVFCRVSLDKGIPSYISGLCVGGVYFAVTLSTNRFIGSAVNPALTLPTAILNSDYQNIALYLTTPFIGSLCGVLLYIILQAEFTNKKPIKKITDNELGSNQISAMESVSENLQQNDVSDRFIEDEDEAESEEMIREE